MESSRSAAIFARRDTSRRYALSSFLTSSSSGAWDWKRAARAISRSARFASISLWCWRACSSLKRAASAAASRRASLSLASSDSRLIDATSRSNVVRWLWTSWCTSAFS